MTPRWNVSEVNPWWKNRLFSIDTTAPVCTFMREKADTEMRESTYALFDLVEKLNHHFVTQRRDNVSSSCNLPYYHNWAKAARQRPQVFQVGQLSSQCFSYLHIPDSISEPSRALLASIRHQDIQAVLRSARNALANATVDISFPLDGAWSTDAVPFDGSRKLIRTNGQFCEIEGVSSFVVDSQVYLKAFVSDQNPLSRVRDYGRQSVFEFINRNFSDTLRMIHRRYQPGVAPSLQNGPYENSTTIVQLTNGILVPTLVVAELADPYSAAVRANSQAVEATDRGNDAITASNIAILALPMAMNLIPMAFVADLATVGTLIYVLLTDVISTLPILLKGVELALLNRPQQSYTSAYFAGDEKLSITEIWSATCHAEYRYGNAGAVFIATASFAMVLGVVLEIWAIRLMRRRQAAAAGGLTSRWFGVSGPFGRAGRLSTKFAPLGTGSVEEQSLFEFEHQNGVYRHLLANYQREFEQNVSIQLQNDPNIQQAYLDLSCIHEDQIVAKQVRQRTLFKYANRARDSLPHDADAPSPSYSPCTRSQRRRQRLHPNESDG